MLRRLHVGRFDGVILGETTIGMIFMKLWTNVVKGIVLRIVCTSSVMGLHGMNLLHNVCCTKGFIL